VGQTFLSAVCRKLDADKNVCRTHAPLHHVKWPTDCFVNNELAGVPSLASGITGHSSPVAGH